MSIQISNPIGVFTAMSVPESLFNKHNDY